MTPRQANDAFLNALAQERGARPTMVPVTVRIAGPDGTLRFAVIVDRDGNRVKVREFAGGAARWIDRAEIVEAA